MRSSPSRAVALSLFLLFAAACREEPDIVEVSPNAELATSVDPATTEPLTPDLPATPTSNTTEAAPSSEPVLEDETAIRIASDFVDALRSDDRSGDFSTAAEMWSGYPAVEEERTEHLAELAAVHPWLLDGDLGFEALDAWSFGPEWTMTLVVITSIERSDVATLLLDRSGYIQRIDSRVFQTPRPMTVDANSVIINALPLEGSANAYLDGVLLNEPIVDHDEMTTTFALPPAPGQPQVFVTSFATPEFPFVTGTIIDRG